MVTFETKVWEGDWRFILYGSRLQKTIARCNYEFVEKRLMINNVDRTKEVCLAADRMIERGIISDYVLVEQYARTALDFFELTKDDLGKGYVYSIAELVSIFLCKTPFLLHFSGDSMPKKNKQDWVTLMLKLLDRNPEIVVANLTWNARHREVMNESLYMTDQFSISQGFSDQMFLIRTADFRKPIYQEWNISSSHYPEYGGELFEKRVHSWMLNQKKYRATLVGQSYRHQNFGKNLWVEKIRTLIR